MIDMQNRYSRQMLLREIGEKGQERIGNTRCLVVGAGGVGGHAALGLVDLVEADLRDRTRDGTRAFKTFSKEDLKRWRMLREAEEKAVKDKVKAKAREVAKKTNVTPSTFSKSIKKVNEYVVEYVKEIMKRRGIR